MNSQTFHLFYFFAMNIQKMKPRLLLLCKIFLIGLLIQFFLQTFVTFQLGRDGTFWQVVRMWKEFILLLFAVAILYAVILNFPKYRKELAYLMKRDEEGTSGSPHSGERERSGRGVSRTSLRTYFKKYSLLHFIVLFLVTAFVFFVIAVLIQKVGLSTFILSIKYDLLPFFIFGLGACLAILFFSEEDKLLFQLYKKLIIFSIWGGLFRRVLLYFMPNALKFFGFDPFIFEGTIGSRPPAAYYTLIKPFLDGSHVRNGFLFERPISFGFWLVAFFPVFVLGFLRKKPIKIQIGYSFLFGLLVLSTWSRAAIVVFGVEFVALALVLH